MKKIFKIYLITFGVAIISACLHLLIRDNFTAPIYCINFPLFIAMFLKTTRSNINNLHFIIITSILIDFFLNTAFGAFPFSMLFAIIIFNWTLDTIFSGQLFYTIGISAMISVISFKFSNIIIYVLLNSSSTSFGDVINRNYVEIIWEIILTTSLLIICFLITKKTQKRISQNYLSSSIFGKYA